MSEQNRPSTPEEILESTRSSLDRLSEELYTLTTIDSPLEIMQTLDEVLFQQQLVYDLEFDQKRLTVQEELHYFRKRRSFFDQAIQILANNESFEAARHQSTIDRYNRNASDAEAIAMNLQVKLLEQSQQT